MMELWFLLRLASMGQQLVRQQKKGRCSINLQSVCCTSAA